MKQQNGQTLIALLIFVLVAMTITLAATGVAIINLQANSAYLQGEQALASAESGIEEALLRLERDPSYSSGSLTLGTGAVTITISGSGTKTITAVGTSGHASRTVTATASITNNIVVLTSWNETP